MLRRVCHSPRVQALRLPPLTCRSSSATLNRKFFLPNNHTPTAEATTVLRSPSIPETNYTGSSLEQLPPVVITPPTLTYPPPHVTEYKPIPALTPARLLGVYSQLSKSRLTTLMVLTAMSGVAMSPLPTTVPVLLATALGTALCSASANTLNQISEIPFDAQMARTRNRPLVRRAITPLHATGFAVVTGIAGPVLLWTCVNPLTATLGTLTLGLYAGVYTPMKRLSVANTWVGAVVGGIPPLMGWTACNGHLLPSPTYPIEFFPPPFLPEVAHFSAVASDNPLAAFSLFMFLFSWQFPHFNSLSRVVRTSYAQGGYKMLSVMSPRQNRLVALRHSLLFIPICSVLTPLAGLTTWAFAVTSLVPNALLIRSAWRFWKSGGDKEARRLFHDSLWYLPVVLGLMMFHKQGISWLEWIGWSEEKAQDAEES